MGQASCVGESSSSVGLLVEERPMLSLRWSLQQQLLWVSSSASLAPHTTPVWDTKDIITLTPRLNHQLKFTSLSLITINNISFINSNKPSSSNQIKCYNSQKCMLIFTVIKSSCYCSTVMSFTCFATVSLHGWYKKKNELSDPAHFRAPLFCENNVMEIYKLHSYECDNGSWNVG